MRAFRARGRHAAEETILMRDTENDFFYAKNLLVQRNFSVTGTYSNVAGNGEFSEKDSLLVSEKPSRSKFWTGRTQTLVGLWSILVLLCNGHSTLASYTTSKFFFM